MITALWINDQVKVLYGKKMASGVSTNHDHRDSDETQNRWGDEGGRV